MPRVRIGWATGEPAEVERALRTVLGGLELANASLELVPPLAGDGPLEVEGRGGVGLGALPAPAPVLVGVGWATVDRERAAAELVDAIPGLLARGFVPVPRDPLLGAHVLVAAGPEAEAGEADERGERGGAAGDRRMAERSGPQPRLVLLEPDTEGRLAGALARHGEGPIALYVAREGVEASGGPGGADAEARLGSEGRLAPDGPFGPGRLIPTPGRFGPFLILLGGLERVPSAP